MYDAVIIGAGVAGCASAMELAKYNARILVLERNEDVCSGTSKANSAIVHAGFDAREGSLMAKLNLMGSLMMPELAKNLDFKYKPIGSLVVCFDENKTGELEALRKRGVSNGVKGLEIIDKDKLRSMEPNISENAASALYAPTGAILCPFNLNIGMAENACANGAKFQLNTEVLDIIREDSCWIVVTTNGEFKAKTVVNAAGVYADKFHNMVSKTKIHITPRKGEYILLDKNAGGLVNHTIFQLPGKYGKGVLVTPTVDGNILLGPTAHDITDKEDTSTTAEGLDEIRQKSTISVKNIPYGDAITSFAGLRAHEDGHEFIIKELEDAPGFIDAAGIESPGLTACPAIGLMVSNIVRDILNLSKKENYIKTRQGVHIIKDMDKAKAKALIEKDHRYANIICRCEKVSEGEIIEAISRPLGAKSLDALKRRVRVLSGRCQGGFCSPKVLKILSKQIGVPETQIPKNNPKSKVLEGLLKKDIREV